MAQFRLNVLVIAVIFSSCALAQQPVVHRVPTSLCNGVPMTGRLLEVRISNCANNFPCVLRKGTQATVEFDYIPANPTGRVTTGATGRIGGIPLPFVGTNNTPACGKIISKQSRQAVGCNQNAGEVYTYTNTFPILQIYPTTNVNVQWELIDGSTREKIVCFNVPARII